jgi:flagellar biosynthesis/type III secretory pathway M-ring protein FliF/YscJ
VVIKIASPAWFALSLFVLFVFAEAVAISPLEEELSTDPEELELDEEDEEEDELDEEDDEDDEEDELELELEDDEELELDDTTVFGFIVSV